MHISPTCSDVHQTPVKAKRGVDVEVTQGGICNVAYVVSLDAFPHSHIPKADQSPRGNALLGQGAIERGCKGWLLVHCIRTWHTLCKVASSHTPARSVADRRETAGRLVVS